MYFLFFYLTHSKTFWKKRLLWQNWARKKLSWGNTERRKIYLTRFSCCIHQNKTLYLFSGKIGNFPPTPRPPKKKPKNTKITFATYRRNFCNIFALLFFLLLITLLILKKISLSRKTEKAEKKQLYFIFFTQRTFLSQEFIYLFLLKLFHTIHLFPLLFIYNFFFHYFKQHRKRKDLF